MMCRIGLHKWCKWRAVLIRPIEYLGLAVIGQVRECERCGKRETREV